MHACMFHVDHSLQEIYNLMIKPTSNTLFTCIMTTRWHLSFSTNHSLYSVIYNIYYNNIQYIIILTCKIIILLQPTKFKSTMYMFMCSVCMYARINCDDFVHAYIVCIRTYISYNTTQHNNTHTHTHTHTHFL